MSIYIRRVIYLLLACFLTACMTNRQQTLDIFHTLDAEQLLLAQSSSSLLTHRQTLEQTTEIQTLLKAGSDAAQLAVERLSSHCHHFSDTSATVYAYILEHSPHPDSVQVLQDYVQSDFKSCGHNNGVYFAIRALLVLQNIPDTSGGYYEYPEATIKQAL